MSSAGDNVEGAEPDTRERETESMELTTTITALLTLAVFSFLYGDNPLYKFAERLLVGLAVGYSLVIWWDNALLQKVLRPALGGESLLPLVPFLIGLLLFARFWRRWSWLTAIPLAAMIGAGVGYAAPALLKAYALNFMIGAVDKVHGSIGAVTYIWALILLIGFVSTLSYFYFGRRGSGFLNAGAKIGTYFLMVFFGATIGYTVMSRMTIMIGRLDFLLRDWLGLIS